MNRKCIGLMVFWRISSTFYGNEKTEFYAWHCCEFRRKCEAHETKWSDQVNVAQQVEVIKRDNKHFMEFSVVVKSLLHYLWHFFVCILSNNLAYSRVHAVRQPHMIEWLKDCVSQTDYEHHFFMYAISRERKCNKNIPRRKPIKAFGVVWGLQVSKPMSIQYFHHKYT